MLKRLKKSKKDEILELPNRREIYRIVLKCAGCHFRELERRSKFSIGILKYHLDYLSRHNIIKQEKFGNNIRYFPIQLSDKERKIIGFIRSKSIRKIILCLMSNYEVTYREIVRFVGLSPSTTSWYLGRLVNNGFVESAEKNGLVYYRLKVQKSMLLRLLIIYKESFMDSFVDRTIEMWGLK